MVGRELIVDSWLLVVGGHIISQVKKAQKLMIRDRVAIFTLYLRYIYAIFTLYLHYIYAVFTLYLRCIYTPSLQVTIDTQ